MAFKLSHILLFLLLWLSIMLILFHEYYHFKAKIINKDKHIMQASDRSLLVSSSSSSSSHLHRYQKKKKKKQNRLITRKVLANTKFDFSPFFKHHLHHQHLQPVPDPSDSQIDPRYGVEKRRVPTGPNPLHH